MKKILSVTVIVAIASMFGCGVQNRESSLPQQLNYENDLKEAGINPQEIVEVDSLLQSFVDQKKLSSAVGFVAKGGGGLYHQAFGWKDVENRIPAAVDDYYVLFSQTKAITTVAFMTLVERGLVAVSYTHLTLPTICSV